MRRMCYEMSHRHPELSDISPKGEFFALGSTIYEIMTGTAPYARTSDKSMKALLGANRGWLWCHASSAREG
jgi:hypothetical protein